MKRKHPDFKDRKIKVGKKLKPLNETRLNFKTTVISVSNQSRKKSLISDRKLSIENFASFLKSPNTNIKKTGLNELLSIISRNEFLFNKNNPKLKKLFFFLSALITDSNQEIRNLAQKVLKSIFESPNGQKATVPFIHIFACYIKSAITHSNRCIRLDALKFLELIFISINRFEKSETLNLAKMDEMVDLKNHKKHKSLINDDEISKKSNFILNEKKIIELFPFVVILLSDFLKDEIDNDKKKILQICSICKIILKYFALFDRQNSQKFMPLIDELATDLAKLSKFLPTLMGFCKFEKFNKIDAFLMFKIFNFLTKFLKNFLFNFDQNFEQNLEKNDKNCQNFDKIRLKINSKKEISPKIEDFCYAIHQVANRCLKSYNVAEELKIPSARSTLIEGIFNLVNLPSINKIKKVQKIRNNLLNNIIFLGKSISKDLNFLANFSKNYPKNDQNLQKLSKNETKNDQNDQNLTNLSKNETKNNQNLTNLSNNNLKNDKKLIKTSKISKKRKKSTFFEENEWINETLKCVAELLKNSDSKLDQINELSYEVFKAFCRLFFGANSNLDFHFCLIDHFCSILKNNLPLNFIGILAKNDQIINFLNTKIDFYIQNYLKIDQMDQKNSKNSQKWLILTKNHEKSSICLQNRIKTALNALESIFQHCYKLRINSKFNFQQNFLSSLTKTLKLLFKANKNSENNNMILNSFLNQALKLLNSAFVLAKICPFLEDELFQIIFHFFRYSKNDQNDQKLTKIDQKIEKNDKNLDKNGKKFDNLKTIKIKIIKIYFDSFFKIDFGSKNDFLNIDFFGLECQNLFNGASFVLLAYFGVSIEELMDFNGKYYNEYLLKINNDLIDLEEIIYHFNKCEKIPPIYSFAFLITPLLKMAFYHLINYFSLLKNDKNDQKTSNFDKNDKKLSNFDKNNTKKLFFLLEKIFPLIKSIGKITPNCFKNFVLTENLPFLKNFSQNLDRNLNKSQFYQKFENCFEKSVENGLEDDLIAKKITEFSFVVNDILWEVYKQIFTIENYKNDGNCQKLDEIDENCQKLVENDKNSQNLNKNYIKNTLFELSKGKIPAKKFLAENKLIEMKSILLQCWQENSEIFRMFLMSQISNLKICAEFQSKASKNELIIFKKLMNEKILKSCLTEGEFFAIFKNNFE